MAELAMGAAPSDRPAASTTLTGGAVTETNTSGLMLLAVIRCASPIAAWPMPCTLVPVLAVKAGAMPRSINTPIEPAKTTVMLDGFACAAPLEARVSREVVAAISQRRDMCRYDVNMQVSDISLQRYPCG